MRRIMLKRAIWGFLAISVLVIAALAAIDTRFVPPATVFWDSACESCQSVNDFLDGNSIDVPVVKRDVATDPANVILLREVLKSCGVDRNLPLAYIDKDCIVSEVATDPVILFYGEECPHCKDLEAWMEEKGVFDLVTVERREVWNNAANLAMMQEKAKECELSGQLGVPFTYHKGKCIMGDAPARKYLMELTGVTE